MNADDRLELAGSDVLVLGLGISGRSAARFCAERGARVVAADERPAEQLEGFGPLAELGGPGAPVELRTGQAFPDVADFDLVIPSPGIPREHYAKGARRIWGDVELAALALRVPIAAVTGTNGKSTTTCLIEALLREAGVRARAAGNLGESALTLVGEPIDVAVLEVSSFQLEATESFRPRVAVVLNITPDHLDRHGDFRHYVEAKARLLANQGEEDTAILNFDDEAVRGLARATRARIVPFSRQPREDGVWLDGESVVLRAGAPEQRVSLDGFALEGRHNRENAAMALAAVQALGANLDAAAPALAHFRGLPHRNEVVRERGGVRFVDDSKATNPGAAARALESFDARVVWIAGGRDKDLDFGGLAAIAERRARAVLLIGEASDALEAALDGRVETERCETLERAVRRAAALARRGEVVLLAPACASFDQFANFAARGEAFRQAVADLPDLDLPLSPSEDTP